jgi:hypothetical protein
MTMNYLTKKTLSVLLLISTPLSMIATHYINNTGKQIKVTNVAATKRNKKSYFALLSKKKNVQPAAPVMIYFIELDNGQEGDLDNNQGDEITITSPGMSDKRKLFPTNNSFNYVITMNAYGKQFEQFDINRAGNEDEMLPIASKKAKAAKKIKDRQEKKKRKKLREKREESLEQSNE